MGRFPDDFSKKIKGYIFAPGSTLYPSAPPVSYNLNSLIHETGHLMGLNDYYSYDTTDRTEEDYSKTPIPAGLWTKSELLPRTRKSQNPNTKPQWKRIHSKSISRRT